MTTENTILNGQVNLVDRAETDTPLPHRTVVKPAPLATGPVIISGDGTLGKNCMSETEKLAAQNEARRAIFRS